jgi:Bacteriocin-protection, YdeI or OmpD-Associated
VIRGSPGLSRSTEPGEQQRFRERRENWAFFSAQAPSYRKAALWWVVSAKRADTRERHLATLVDDSAAGRRLRHLQRPGSRA